MAKHRRYENTREDIEDLHGEIRRLRKIVKNQQREVARLRKYEQRAGKSQVSDNTHQNASGKQSEPSKSQCGTCFSKKVDIMDLGFKVYSICKDCGERKQIK